MKLAILRALLRRLVAMKPSTGISTHKLHRKGKNKTEKCSTQNYQWRSLKTDKVT